MYYQCEARGAACGAFTFSYEERPFRCQLLTNITLPLAESELVIPSHSVMVRERGQLSTKPNLAAKTIIITVVVLVEKMYVYVSYAENGFLSSLLCLQ